MAPPHSFIAPLEIVATYGLFELIDQRRVIALTGASSGIGAAVTRALADDGHTLFVCARRKDKLHEVTEGGRLAQYREADVAEESDVAAFAEMVGRDAGHVDVLICCAGSYGPIGLFHQVNSDDWWRALQANLFGTYLVVKHFTSLLANRSNARIVTFSGGGAFNPLPRYSAYACSKAAVVRLTETMAEELRPLGIKVNGIAPGFVSTEIHEATLAAGPQAAGEEFYATTKTKIENGSVPVSVVVNCVRYLISDAANALTGKTLSASFDPWKSTEFASYVDRIADSDLYTMQRIDLENLAPSAFTEHLKIAPRGDF